MQHLFHFTYALGTLSLNELDRNEGEEKKKKNVALLAFKQGGSSGHGVTVDLRGCGLS